MKKAVLFLALLTLSVSLGAQSLADLARSEKARRESYRGRHAVVIRNVDLMRVQKVPAVEIAYPESDLGAFQEEGQGLEPGTVALDAAGSVEAPADSGGVSSPQLDLSASPAGTPLPEENAPAPPGAKSGALEAQLTAARDMVDLLTTKMNALRQQYEYQDTMVPGYVIQEQLAETEKRLLKAQAQLARIEAQAKK